MGDDFVHVWSRKHFDMMVEAIFTTGKFNFLVPLLNESLGQNAFLSLSEFDRLKFVKDLYTRLLPFTTPQVISDCLATRYYAPYLLLILIERDQFRKLQNYTVYESCLDLVSQQDMQQLSTSQ